jgi:FkbM family methyltransferase
MPGGRPAGVIARNALRPANYLALFNMARRYERPLESARRYFRRSGDYPYACGVRTPQGIVRPTLWSWHDMLTVNEIFCREDYRAGPKLRTVVDVGSNIGISALYFLTRHPEVRCRLFEPVPRNVERLRSNLAGFEGRYELEQVAVADTEGTLPFATDEAGRYGGLDRRDGELLEVRVRHVNDVLEEAIAGEGAIDLLKLDIEGAEERTVRAIRPDLLRRVGVVYLEARSRDAVELPGFSRRWRCETLRLERQA